MCFVERAYNRNMFHWCWNYISQTDYIKPFAGEELYKCNMIKVMINMKENLRGHIQYLCTSIKHKYIYIYICFTLQHCFLFFKCEKPYTRSAHSIWVLTWLPACSNISSYIFLLKHCLKEVNITVPKDTLFNIKDHIEFYSQKRPVIAFRTTDYERIPLHTWNPCYLVIPSLPFPLFHVRPSTLPLNEKHKSETNCTSLCFEDNHKQQHVCCDLSLYPQLAHHPTISDGHILSFPKEKSLIMPLFLLSWW